MKRKREDVHCVDGVPVTLSQSDLPKALKKYYRTYRPSCLN